MRRAYARLADHTMIYSIDRWGESWNLADSRPRRHINSVILEGETAQRLINDVQEFFQRRQWYADLGIPGAAAICSMARRVPARPALPTRWPASSTSNCAPYH
jgi:hypothetical protein